MIFELLPKFLQQPSFASYSRETFETTPFEQLLSIQSTATTTKKKKEKEGAWRSKALRDSGGERGTSFELRTQCFMSPPFPEVLSFALTSPHIPRLVPVPLPRAKAAPLVIYLCNNNNLAATPLLQLFNTSLQQQSCNSPLHLQQQQQQSSQLSSTSATAAQLQLSYKTNKKNGLKFTDYAQYLNF